MIAELRLRPVTILAQSKLSPFSVNANKPEYQPSNPDG